MNYKNKKGFTLLEIIIVIIIIGVLASLALPRFFSTVEFSRSTEAMNAISTVRKSLERCAVFSNNYAVCDSFTNIDVENPSVEAGSHYTYAMVGNGDSSNKSYTITATRNTLDGGTAGHTVIITLTTAAVTRGGTTAFAAIK